MNYIIIDLEWNQGTAARQEVEKLPFEIIEIGAVKLNRNREWADTFQRIIKPVVYPDLFPVTKELIHIQEEELQEGMPFVQAMRELLEWCGEEYYFCTWGPMDLVELQRNMKYYKMERISDKPFLYYDVQKLFSLETEGRKNARSLEYAVEYFQLEKEGSFHRALWDAEYTARVFQRLNINIITQYYSLDFYNNPKKKEDEVYTVFGNYSKLISREFGSREEAMYTPDIKALKCFLCGRQAVRKIDWFSNNPKNYYCLGYCKEHGYLKGRIQMNRSESGKRFVIKIVSRINKDAAQTIALHCKEIEQKKQDKKTRLTP